MLVVYLQPNLAQVGGDTSAATFITTQQEKKKENENIQKKKPDDSNHNSSQYQQQYSSLSFSKILATLPLHTKLISSSYILLYFTILSPGAMLNAWMNSMNDNDNQDSNPIVTEQTIAYFG